MLGALFFLLFAVAAWADSCDCTGDNSGIPSKQKTFANTDYGTRCEAWDDTHRYCRANAIKRALIKSGEDRDCWCPEAWCYVSASCPHARKSSFKDSGLYYSYATCGNDGNSCFNDDEAVESFLDAAQDEKDHEDGSYMASFFFDSYDEEDVAHKEFRHKEIASIREYNLCVISSCYEIKSGKLLIDRSGNLSNEDHVSWEPADEPITNTYGESKPNCLVYATEGTWMIRLAKRMSQDVQRMVSFTSFGVGAVVNCYKGFENLDEKQAFDNLSDREYYSSIL